ncbi:MAG: RluA family pseudouridine synthase [Bacilli bacterium]|nr:RluA family pseudouridine synthase [Bacilli bacterium]
MKLVVDREDIRIDKYLGENTEFSRELITKMLKEGYILVNGKITKPSYKTKLEDVVEIDDTYKIEQDINPVEMTLDIVYEDDDIMVINKPSGLVVHPGNGNTNNTLVNGLMYYTNELSDLGGNERVGIVHRLDKDTSGLMLVAKSNRAHEILSDDFKNKRVYREYYALLIGNFPSDTAHIDAPIGRSKTNFNKMEVRSDGKVARTNLKVLKRYKDYTLVSLVLETGRTHQIRVHMSYIGYPIFNDPVYVNKEATSFGQFLHSKVIRFTHPITKEQLEFTSELPREFNEYLEKLD